VAPAASLAVLAACNSALFAVPLLGEQGRGAKGEAQEAKCQDFPQQFTHHSSLLDIPGGEGKVAENL